MYGEDKNVKPEGIGKARPHGRFITYHQIVLHFTICHNFLVKSGLCCDDLGRIAVNAVMYVDDYLVFVNGSLEDSVEEAKKSLQSWGWVSASPMTYHATMSCHFWIFARVSM